MNFELDEISESIRTVWARMLALDIEPAPADRYDGGPQSIAASIRIIGGWNGAVLLECPVELARSAAAILFGISPAEVDTADMQDAVVELVRRIGDRMTVLLPRGSRWLLLARVENSDWAGLGGDWPVGHVVFRCQGQHASIAIAEEIGQQATAMAA